MFKPGEYDLVLLDIQLPDMTGLDISRELTKRYPREDLPPLVALTANVLKDKQEYLNAGMDDVLSKPLSVPALTAMIKKFWDTQDDEESTVTTEENSKSEALLDIPMLEQYLELVGPKLITDGLAVFEKMMPGSVSYTHLDVYKRQALASPPCSNSTIRRPISQYVAVISALTLRTVSVRALSPLSLIQL